MLLEPFYAFHLTIPDKMVGRAMTDLERRFAVFEGPALEDGQAILTGRAPVSALDGYQTEVTAYTGGLGQMICTLDGYGPCHNEEEIIAAAGYDPDAGSGKPERICFLCTRSWICRQLGRGQRLHASGKLPGCVQWKAADGGD